MRQVREQPGCGGRRIEASQLHQHIARLCEEHDIYWERGCPRNLSVAHEHRITTPPIGGQRAYFTALHEVGHVVQRHTGYWRKPILEQEAEAWRWAFEHALVEPNLATIKQVSRDLASYWLYANQDKRLSLRAPEFERLWDELRARCTAVVHFE